MPIGFVIGMAIAFLLLFGPAILIAFSKKAKGGQKFKWILLSLAPFLVIGSIGTITLFALIQRNSTLVMWLTPTLNILGYAASWAVYAAFKKKIATSS